ncbi:hypothetical protein GCM10012286_28240 [Streptomyces lasiicapitis]|uniref:Uncharacterized protein n=1 Tax=Streptomyces lasiicapitis TaxID=1923961 RepID=A0ABQ2LUZ8_9ACTN|nr:hypothetical protein GCM10012286_28240 [Streptomyces lasiicapitis]
MRVVGAVVGVMGAVSAVGAVGAVGAAMVMGAAGPALAVEGAGSGDGVAVTSLVARDSFDGVPGQEVVDGSAARSLPIGGLPIS